MTFQERVLALRLVDAVDCVARVGEAEDEHVTLRVHPRLDHQDFAEIDLHLRTRRRPSRDERGYPAADAARAVSARIRRERSCSSSATRTFSRNCSISARPDVYQPLSRVGLQARGLATAGTLTTVHDLGRDRPSSSHQRMLRARASRSRPEVARPGSRQTLRVQPYAVPRETAGGAYAVPAANRACPRTGWPDRRRSSLCVASEGVWRRTCSCGHPPPRDRCRLVRAEPGSRMPGRPRHAPKRAAPTGPSPEAVPARSPTLSRRRPAPKASR